MGKKTRERMVEGTKKVAKTWSDKRLLKEYKIQKYLPYILIPILLIVNYINASIYRTPGVATVSLLTVGFTLYYGHSMIAPMKAEIDRRKLKIK
jgi:hypothetical protein